jgi:hypothetical protein
MAFRAGEGAIKLAHSEARLRLLLSLAYYSDANLEARRADSE